MAGIPDLSLIPKAYVSLLLTTLLFSSYGLHMNYNSTQPVNPTLFRNAGTVLMHPWAKSVPKGIRTTSKTEGIKHTLDNYPNARCLDGTPGAYYISQPDPPVSKKWYIFRQGGGFCFDMEDCEKRAQTELGSSSELRGWVPKLSMESEDTDPHMGFSRTVEDNPLIHDWNFVYVIYCDGGYYAGRNMTRTGIGFLGLRTLHFKGSYIMEGIFDDLKAKFKFAEATDIVVGGCSAGGISTITTGDWIKSYIDKIAPSAKFAGFSCSGFFLDYDYESTRYTTKKYFPYHQNNLSGSLSKSCLDMYKDMPHKCLVSHVASSFSKVPLFLWESLYDSYMLEHVLDGKCETPDCANPHGKNIQSALYNLWHIKPEFGGYLSPCSHHCEGSTLGSVKNLVPVDGVKPMAAFGEWYKSFVSPKTGNGKQRYWEKDAQFPCIDCCPPASMGAHHHHPLDDYYE